MQILIANWKAHKSITAITPWFESFRATLQQLKPDSLSPADQQLDRTVVIAPAFFLLPGVAAEVTKTAALVRERLGAQLTLGAQDVSHLGAGSYTGAVAAIHLPSLGVTHVIVGHSEQRRYFGETNQQVAGKVDQALDAGLKPVVCVDRSYAHEQITMLNQEWLPKVIIAYEPQAAIGSGQSAAPESVQQEVAELRTQVSQVPIIYGGSITEENVGQYLLITDGGLVGTAAVEGDAFARVLAAAW